MNENSKKLTMFYFKKASSKYLLNKTSLINLVEQTYESIKKYDSNATILIDLENYLNSQKTIVDSATKYLDIASNLLLEKLKELDND